MSDTMSDTVFAYSRADVARQAKLRPPGYVEELRKAFVKEDARFVWIDTAHPVFVALAERHKCDPRVGLSLDQPDEEKAPRPLTAEEIEAGRKRREEQGRKQWAHLHRFCLTGDAREPATLAAFLAAFEKGVPCGPCREHWKQILAADPPDAADPFGWSVRAHNAVNRKLGKQELTEREAQARWACGE